MRAFIIIFFTQKAAFRPLWNKFVSHQSTSRKKDIYQITPKGMPFKTNATWIYSAPMWDSKEGCKRYLITKKMEEG